MMQKIKLLDAVINSNLVTFYFIHKNSKILLPVEININTLDTPVYETLKKTFSMLGITFDCINIYLFKESNFYSHLKINAGDRVHEININTLDALNLARYLSIPVYIEEGVLEECGIKMTKEMIEKVLIS